MSSKRRTCGRPRSDICCSLVHARARWPNRIVCTSLSSLDWSASLLGLAADDGVLDRRRLSDGRR